MATLVITLHTKARPASKLGFILQGIFLFMSIPVLIYVGIALSKSLLFLSMLTFASVFLLLFLSKWYFEKVFFTEKIIVSYSKMTILYRTFFKEVKHEFLLRDVHSLGFAGRAPGKSVKKAQVTLVENGTIELETEKQIFRFGKNNTAGETAELIKKIEGHLGRNFMNNHMELLYH